MATKHRYVCTGKIWLYPGESAAWHFVTLPKKEGVQIKEMYAPLRRGFGSLPVSVTIGKTTWDTSIFPDSRSGSYLLPLKAAVRKKEELLVDDSITFTLTIRSSTYAIKNV
jgi:hypothetical protein